MEDGEVPLPLQTNPARHGWHGMPPPTPYCPASHGEPADDTDAAPQPKPSTALQLLQVAEPGVENRPGVQEPLHVDVVDAGLPPK
jgi:hypothetical protein